MGDNGAAKAPLELFSEPLSELFAFLTEPASYGTFVWALRWIELVVENFPISDLHMLMSLGGWEVGEWIYMTYEVFNQRNLLEWFIRRVYKGCVIKGYLRGAYYIHKCP